MGHILTKDVRGYGYTITAMTILLTLFINSIMILSHIQETEVVHFTFAPAPIILTLS